MQKQKNKIRKIGRENENGYVKKSGTEQLGPEYIGNDREQ